MRVGGGGWEDGNRPFGGELKPSPERKAQRAQGEGGSGWFLQKEMPGRELQELEPAAALVGPWGVFGIFQLLLLCVCVTFF